MKKLILIVAAIVAFAGFALAPIVFLGCASPPPAESPITVTVEQKQAAAGAKYAVQLLDCVDKNRTAPDIDACANAVRERWLTDGGAR